MLTLTNYVNGRFVAPVGGQWFDKIDPATGKRRRASTGQRRAATLPPPSKPPPPPSPPGRALPSPSARACYSPSPERIEDRLTPLAEAECRDTGNRYGWRKPWTSPRAASNFRFFATASLHFHSEAYRTDQLALNYTLRQPRGVCGLISPWNLPLYLFTWKVAPALATGNTVVAKPSELTPTTAFLLAEIAREVGLPPGVFNVVHGYGHKVGAALVAHPGVPTVSFTGGTATGADIARVAAPLFKKVALELGGKNPNVIFADADLEEVLKTSIRSSFENQGEICLCGSRLFVEQSIYPTFVERFVEMAQRLKVGDPLDPTVDQGALISRGHFDKVMSYIQLAKAEGGRIVCGGGPAKNVG